MPPTDRTPTVPGPIDPAALPASPRDVLLLLGPLHRVTAEDFAAPRFNDDELDALTSSAELRHLLDLLDACPEVGEHRAWRVVVDDAVQSRVEAFHREDDGEILELVTSISEELQELDQLSLSKLRGLIGLLVPAAGPREVSPHGRSGNRG